MSTEPSLKTDGYCVLRDILSLSEIGGLRAAITRTIERVARAMRTNYATSHPELPLEERFDRIAADDRAYAVALYHAVMADTQRDPRVVALTKHERLTEAVQALLSPLERTGEVIRPRAAIPVFQAYRSPWHQDVTDVSDMREELGIVRLACWMPLADVAADDGALEVAPGIWNEPLPHRTNSQERIAIPEELIASAPRQAIGLAQGDVLVLDRFIPHRALPVVKGKARWTFVMWVKAKKPAVL